MSENLKSAETFWKQANTAYVKEEMHRPFKDYIISAMHSFAEQAVREFAERVKGADLIRWSRCDGRDIPVVHHDGVESLRDQLISEIKEK